MSRSSSPLFFLWLIGIWQPVSAEELSELINSNFVNVFGETNEEELIAICRGWTNEKLLIRVNRNPNLFSLTQKGNDVLSKDMRRTRDRARLFLLKDTNRAGLVKSETSGVDGLDGEAPSVNVREGMQSSETNGLASFVPSNQGRWPRYTQQFLRTGRSSEVSDNFTPNFISFFEPVQVRIARGSKEGQESIRNIAMLDLALILGVSHQLLASMLRHEKHHYRIFELPKKTGGSRTIEAPRVFLKVVQRFILDFYLRSLPVHESVMSFRPGKSVVNNAQMHSGQAYVGSIDIKNFFSSIKRDMVTELLTKHNYPPKIAELFSDLCTKDNRLPQGAPTSPVISNALLYSIDKTMQEYAACRGLKYSRYADDITVSGSEAKDVDDALVLGADRLKREYGLSMNSAKRRIMSQNGRQVVTGLVVNEKVQPVRLWRRKIRAAFHNASKKDGVTEKCLNRLRGYYGYLAAIPDLRESAGLQRYKATLDRLGQNYTDGD